MLLSLAATVKVPWLVVMGLVTVLAVWVTLGAVVDKTPRAVAVIVFVAIVVWSGALGFAREIGDRTPDLSLARVDLRDGNSVGGYFLGRSSSHVFLAQDDAPPDSEDRDDAPTDSEDRDDTPTDSEGRHVLTLADEDVERVVYGRTVVLAGTDSQEGRFWDFLVEANLTEPIQKPVEPGPGTEGKPPAENTPPAPDITTDDTVNQPTYAPSPEEPFERTDAIASRDETVSGVPVRLELLGLRRTGNVVHLDLRVLNMAQTPHSAARLLSLYGGSDFDTPRLTDPAGQRVYQVSRGQAGCDCSDGLSRIKLDRFESLRLWAMVVVPPSVATVDLTVPGFGTFQDVAIG